MALLAMAIGVCTNQMHIELASNILSERTAQPGAMEHCPHKGTHMQASLAPLHCTLEGLRPTALARYCWILQFAMPFCAPFSLDIAATKIPTVKTNVSIKLHRLVAVANALGHVKAGLLLLPSSTPLVDGLHATEKHATQFCEVQETKISQKVAKI
jgi:hypothetical protein